jgi:multidrug efflux pump subunit AcrB
MLTLFAMILVTFVVDDAMSSSRPFTLNWMKLSQPKKLLFCNERNLGAIISITLVMSAVFIPVSFKRTSWSLPTVCSNFGHCYFDFGR